MIRISISEEIASACPDLCILSVSCDVSNSVSDLRLWNEISVCETELSQTLKIEDINKLPPILATRQAYKCLGKDPNRYRPSAEALLRRIVRKQSIYKVDTLVDSINLLSIQSGYSIGGFDADKINGDLLLGVGREGELYQGIGKGLLNIEGLPVYRDWTGGIGTPTSDEERTKITAATSRLLMILNGYSGMEGLAEAGRYGVSLLKKYASARNIVAELLVGDKRTDMSAEINKIQ